MLLMTSYLVTRATDRDHFFFPNRFLSILKNPILPQKIIGNDRWKIVWGFFSPLISS